MLRAFYAIAGILCLLSAGCGQRDSNAGGSQSAALQITRLDPDYTTAGKGFNAQPDGQSALAVAGKDIPKGATIFWNDQPLSTVDHGSQGFVSAVIPAGLYANPGMAKVSLRSKDGAAASNALDFTIYPQAGPDPQITDLYPTSAVAGKGFNLQPGGDSALGVNGKNFLPGAKVVFGKTELKTSFGNGAYVSALVPAAMAARAGAFEISVVNPDGKTSNKVPLPISRE